MDMGRYLVEAHLREDTQSADFTADGTVIGSATARALGGVRGQGKAAVDSREAFNQMQDAAQRKTRLSPPFTHSWEQLAEG